MLQISASKCFSGLPHRSQPHSHGHVKGSLRTCHHHPTTGQCGLSRTQEGSTLKVYRRPQGHACAQTFQEPHCTGPCTRQHTAVYSSIPSHSNPQKWTSKHRHKSFERVKKLSKQTACNTPCVPRQYPT